MGYMIVVDKPRPKKRPIAVLGGDAPTEEHTRFAFCPNCHTATPMVKPVRRVSSGIAITSGACACGRATFRVGAVRESDVGDLA